MNDDWTTSEWYKEWQQLAKRDYHGQRCGQWFCYIDEDGKLQYAYEKYEHRRDGTYISTRISIKSPNRL